MMLTYGYIRFRPTPIGAHAMPLFSIGLGNEAKILENSKTLGPFRDLDHFRIAVALREMADELDRQTV